MHTMILIFLGIRIFSIDFIYQFIFLINELIFNVFL